MANLQQSNNHNKFIDQSVDLHMNDTNKDDNMINLMTT